MLHGSWVLFLLAGRAVWGRALSGHGSQSMIILHFSPFGGGDGRKTVTKLVINAKRYFHLLSFFLLLHHTAWLTSRRSQVENSHVLASSQCGTHLQLLYEQRSIGGGGGDSLVLASFGLRGWISVDYSALGSGARCSGRL